MAEEFVIVQVGTMEDGRTPAYQIFQRVGDWTVDYYVPVTFGIQNDPKHLSLARGDLEFLQRHYAD